MKRLFDSRLLRAAALIAGILATSGPAIGQTNYVVANDDQSGVVREGVSFYTVGTSGQLTRKKEVSTGGFGISGGYFGQTGSDAQKRRPGLRLFLRSHNRRHCGNCRQHIDRGRQR